MARSVLLLLGATACAVGFHDVAKRYDGFRSWDGPPAGLEPHPFELAFDAWYVLLGGVMVALLATAIAARPGDVARAETRVAELGRSPWLVPVTGLVVLVAALVVKDVVLAGAPVSDDESVYDFIAKTLAAGRLKNPVPTGLPSDLELLRTNFVVLDESGWYGKYPIGHPLWLAVGEALGVRFVVCPLLAACAAMTTVLVARRLLGDGGAAITAILVGTSPQLVCTAATNLSQNTTTLMLMLGVLALLDAADAIGRRRVMLLACAGTALGAGFLARPMPGAPLAVACVAWLAFARDAGVDGRSWRARITEVGVVAVPIATFVAILGLTHLVQTGSPFVTGYEKVHGATFSVHQQGGAFSASLATAVLRQSFWAFGWPCSLIFVPLAAVGKGRSRLALVWLALAGGYAYRLITPKVFVGTTGPVYVAEMVPLIALLSAAGMMRARSWLHDVRPNFAFVPASIAIASVGAAVVMFLPFQLSWLEKVARPQRFVPDSLTAMEAKSALVFMGNVTRRPGATWALWPPPPPPDLAESVIYVRLPVGPDPLRQMHDFWRRRFPDRRAFAVADPEVPAALHELRAPVVSPVPPQVGLGGPAPAVSADRR